MYSVAFKKKKKELNCCGSLRKNTQDFFSHWYAFKKNTQHSVGLQTTHTCTYTHTEPEPWCPPNGRPCEVFTQKRPSSRVLWQECLIGNIDVWLCLSNVHWLSIPSSHTISMLNIKLEIKIFFCLLSFRGLSPHYKLILTDTIPAIFLLLLPKKKRSNYVSKLKTWWIQFTQMN